ncbi:hypothetical protein NMY22_g18382 [Coprinellus aureogranulatus]|nr:hypothetical protein NMY22_g18382 [Coprinellus aureogranulatus]
MRFTLFHLTSRPILFLRVPPSGLDFGLKSRTYNYDPNSAPYSAHPYGHDSSLDSVHTQTSSPDSVHPYAHDADTVDSAVNWSADPNSDGGTNSFGHMPGRVYARDEEFSFGSRENTYPQQRVYERSKTGRRNRVRTAGRLEIQRTLKSQSYREHLNLAGLDKLRGRDRSHTRRRRVGIPLAYRALPHDQQTITHRRNRTTLPYISHSIETFVYLSRTRCLPAGTTEPSPDSYRAHRMIGEDRPSAIPPSSRFTVWAHKLELGELLLLDSPLRFAALKPTQPTYTEMAIHSPHLTRPLHPLPPITTLPFAVSAAPIPVPHPISPAI